MKSLGKKLYKFLETGDKEKILNVSKELDKIILYFMKMQKIKPSKL